MREAGSVAGLFFYEFKRVLQLGNAAFDRGAQELPRPLGRSAPAGSPVVDCGFAGAAFVDLGCTLSLPWITDHRPRKETGHRFGVCRGAAQRGMFTGPLKSRPKVACRSACASRRVIRLLQHGSPRRDPEAS
jgi:hypothetical protein